MYIDYHYYQPPIGRLLQLVPAEPGWYGIYGLYNRETGQARIMKRHIAFWAVAKRFEYEGIFFIGVIREGLELMMLPETSDGLPFLGYSYPDCEINWEYEAEWKYKQIQKAKES